MDAHQANGAQLGWLLIPEHRAVEIWPGEGEGEPELMEPATQLSGDPQFPDLQINLDEIWQV